MPKTTAQSLGTLICVLPCSAHRPRNGLCSSVIIHPILLTSVNIVLWGVGVTKPGKNVSTKQVLSILQFWRHSSACVF